jgi:EpsI family protein
MNTKNFYIVIIILIIVGIVSFLSYLPSRFETQFDIKMSNFPNSIGEWTAEDIPLDERTYKLLETKNLIMRDYKNPKGETVNLYIVYSKDNRKVSHPPEICLQGGGATVVEKTHINVTNTIKANKLIIEKKLSRELAVYWYKVGKINTNVFLSQQLVMAVSNLFGSKTSIAMIRVLTEIEDEKQEAALNKIKTFCSLIEPLLNKYVP